MNSDSFETLIEKHNQDFNTALNIYENNYSHEDLIEFLKSGSVAQKQAAALKLETINNQNEAQIFIRNLTGCDGKIREAISFRLPEFVKKNPEFFTQYTDILLDAIIDINGNICRNTISSLKFLKNDEQFQKDFCTKLCKNTLNLAKKAKTFDIQDGKYKINKEIFKLYWYLETMSEFTEYIDKSSLLDIIMETKSIFDYTIREKTAKILSKLEQYQEFSEIRKELKEDKNYYVRRI